MAVLGLQILRRGDRTPKGNRMTDEPTEPCGNDDCDKCNPKPRWRISAHRVQHITYEREIKAATAEEAMKIFEEGTAWPTSYDDHYGKIVQQDAPVITQVTDERKLTYYREDCCYHDLPSKLEAAGLGHLNNPDNSEGFDE
jgi:hypothetical protein